MILAVTGAAGAEEQSGFSSQPQNGASETVVQESEKLGTNELSSESVSPPPTGGGGEYRFPKLLPARPILLN